MPALTEEYVANITWKSNHVKVQDSYLPSF